MDRPQSPDSARASLAKTRGLRTHFSNAEKGGGREKGGADLGPVEIHENSGSELKTSDRRFQMRLAQRFLQQTCSSPSISMRLQKRFSILTR